MCGITGIFYLDDERVSKATLSRFNNSQKHRGPDGEGIYINEDTTLGLAHRRLSILDISENGKQPMSCCDGRYHITYNGEVYNFIELRNELEKEGYPFRTNTDTEVILAAYRKWGRGCLEKFNGMWAFAIWDSFEKSLFLARDRFGIKPLYLLWIKNRVLAFASETISFRNLEGYSRSVNEQHLASVLQNSFALEGYGETIFNEISQLPGGHYCIFKKGDQKPEYIRWWNTLDNRVNVQNDFLEQTKQFRDLFFDSCKLRLRSDVPIATALSGGLDSSSVYSTIKYLSNKNISKERLPDDWQTAFVATFPGADNDEREFADQVIKGVNGKAIYTIPDDANLAEQIISTTRLFDSIYSSPVSVAVDVYKAMNENGYKVSLDGHGVDEMLYGYPHTLVNAYSAVMNARESFLAEDIKVTYEGLFPAHATPPSLMHTVSKKGLKTRISAYFPDFAREGYRFLRRKLNNRRGIPSGRWIKDQHLLIEESKFYPGIDQLSDLEKGIFKEFHLTTLPTILRNFDRASMQNGIEIRMPFMDWRLVSFVFSLPFTSKVSNGYTKNILRHAMKNIVPEPIRLRKTKIGFNSPMPMWFSNQLRSFIHDEVNSLSFSNSVVWNATEIKKFVDKNSKNSWSWYDCNKFWPYLNAHLITKPD